MKLLVPPLGPIDIHDHHSSALARYKDDFRMRSTFTETVASHITGMMVVTKCSMCLTARKKQREENEVLRRRLNSKNSEEATSDNPPASDFAATRAHVRISTSALRQEPHNFGTAQELNGAVTLILSTRWPSTDALYHDEVVTYILAQRSHPFTSPVIVPPGASKIRDHCSSQQPGRWIPCVTIVMGKSDGSNDGLTA